MICFIERSQGVNLSEIRKKITLIQKEREALELKCIKTRSPMEAGSLVLQHTACKKGNCKCTRGELHGPFLYLSQKVDGKLKSKYVGKESDKPTVKKVRAYMDYQDMLAKIRKTGKELDELLNQYRELLITRGKT